MSLPAGLTSNQSVGRGRKLFLNAMNLLHQLRSFFAPVLSTLAPDPANVEKLQRLTAALGL